MAKRRSRDPKVEALRQRGSLNRHPEEVTDELFTRTDFFDARDLVQLKYEMVRRVGVDGHPVSHTAAAFGFSRPVFYHAQAAFEEGGLGALLPKKRGPRGAHKLNAQVVAFLQRALSKDESLRPSDLVQLVQERFAYRVHPRSIERALKRRGKKRQ